MIIASASQLIALLATMSQMSSWTALICCLSTLGCWRIFSIAMCARKHKQYTSRLSRTKQAHALFANFAASSRPVTTTKYKSARKHTSARHFPTSPPITAPPPKNTHKCAFTYKQNTRRRTTFARELIPPHQQRLRLRHYQRPAQQQYAADQQAVSIHNLNARARSANYPNVSHHGI